MIKTYTFTNGTKIVEIKADNFEYAKIKAQKKLKVKRVDCIGYVVEGIIKHEHS